MPGKYSDLAPYLDKFQRDVVGLIEGDASDAQDSADVADDKAENAQDTADTALAGATLSLAQVQALSEAAAALNKEFLFLGGVY